MIKLASAAASLLAAAVIGSLAACGSSTPSPSAACVHAVKLQNTFAQNARKAGYNPNVLNGSNYQDTLVGEQLAKAMASACGNVPVRYFSLLTGKWVTS